MRGQIRGQVMLNRGEEVGRGAGGGRDAVSPSMSMGNIQRNYPCSTSVTCFGDFDGPPTMPFLISVYYLPSTFDVRREISETRVRQKDGR